MTGLAEQLASRLPPQWLGYRWIRSEPLREYVARRSNAADGAPSQRLHAEQVERNPLPRNIHSLDQLPDDAGWWGFSFRDVPSRLSGETLLAHVRDARVVWYSDAARAGDFYPAVVTGDGIALEMREVKFRPRHADVLRSARPVHLRRATWILERVYHNHSHWLTAHLPKLLLLRQLGQLGDVLLPRERTPVMDDSLRMIDIDPGKLAVFDAHVPLRVDDLTVMATDRFRPELLRLVVEAFAPAAAPVPTRRVFISRRHAARRRLVNEDAIWPLFSEAGFERVELEDLSFGVQVALMRETAVVAGAHGAGLTNMLFCAPGIDVMEIADLDFPNPNFYALASALGHRYWLLPGQGRGDGRPIDRDLHVAPQVVAGALEALGT